MRSSRLLLVCLSVATSNAWAQVPEPEPASPPPAVTDPAPPSASEPASGDGAPAAASPKKRAKTKAASPAKSAATQVPAPAPSSAIADPAPSAPPAPPPIPESTAAPGSEAERTFVRGQAHGFFSRLILSDARGLVRRSGFPFQLEGKRLDTGDALLEEWNRQLRSKRADLLILYDIEVLTPAEMEKKYGKPPARLANLPWQGARTYVAVANLSGHAAIAVFRSGGKAFQVVGYTD